MGLRKRLIDAVTGRKQTVRQENNGQIHVSALCSAYENLFAQLRPLIDEMETVIPYGVGRNGARLAENRTPELAQLIYSPNKDMGWTEFADAMFATWLTEDELNIRIHKKGRSVVGYTILPVGSRVRLGNGRCYFQTVSADGLWEQVSEDEVATLRFSRNPRDLSRGVSPASSVFTWSQIDDLMAQFQKAFFENGAVPASITFITASTKERYEEARRNMERDLGGARNKNKTLFIWRQLLDTGESADQVEIKTIQGNNSTLALEQISKIINDKLNKAVGVSNFILGDDSSAKYDNAELSDRQFTKRRVYPALKRFWEQFQHEMDRIMGGLGYAIQFDLEIPELTDRLKTKAEIAEKNSKVLTDLIIAGSRPSAARIALGLDEEWQSVADGIYAQHLKDRAASEVVQRAESAIKRLEGGDERFLGKAVDNTADTIKTQESANCGVVGHACEHCADGILVESLTDEERAVYEQLLNIAKIQFGFNLEELDEAKIRGLIATALKVQSELGAEMSIEQVEAVLAGSETDEELAKIIGKEGYHLSSAYYERMDKRTNRLVDSFEGEAREAVAEVLGSNEAMTQSELQAKLAEAMTKGVSDELAIQKLINRAATIARNEVGYSFLTAGMENDKYLYDKYALKMGYKWRARHDSKTCDVCAAMDGQIVKIGDSFAGSVHVDTGTRLVNGKIVGEDTRGLTNFGWEQNEWNDDGAIPHAHVNCRCRVDRVLLSSEDDNAN